MTFFAPSFLSTVFTVLQVKSAFPFKIQRIYIIYRDSIYLYSIYLLSVVYSHPPYYPEGLTGASILNFLDAGEVF